MAGGGKVFVAGNRPYVNQDYMVLVIYRLVYKVKHSRRILGRIPRGDLGKSENLTDFSWNCSGFFRDFSCWDFLGDFPAGIFSARPKNAGGRGPKNLAT